MSDEIRHHRRTRRLLWTMLVAASVASTAGNIAHAAEHRDAVTAAGALIAAAIPPLALLSLTHLAGMWSRISARGVVYWCFLFAVACIAVAAFRLSFDALRSLAMQYGYGRTDAALFPLILDGLVAVCTLGLVVLSRLEAPRRDTAGDAGGADGAAGESRRDTTGQAGAAGDAAPLPQVPAALPRGAGDGARNTALSSGDSRTAPREAVWRNGAVQGGAAAASRIGEVGAAVIHRDTAMLQNEPAEDGFRELAQRLVDAGRTTVHRDAVQQALSRTAAGHSTRAVATQLDLSPSAVQRIIRAARDEEIAGART